MSNNGYYYRPIPPRVWSRVEGRCSGFNNVNVSVNNTYIQTITQNGIQYTAQMLEKGNVLQYKKNASNITKKQKYSQISNGLWNGRKKSFASQSMTISNPNTSSLLRVNYENIPYPNQIVGQPNNPSGPYQTGVPQPFDCSTNSIPSGGNLVCGTFTKPCSGEIIQKTKASSVCNPTYCSDVPGRIMNLCWNNGLQTWYPRNRYTMNNSSNKWPQGYKGFQSAVLPVAPTLSIDSIIAAKVALSWVVISNVCIPISAFKLYRNGLLFNTFAPQITSTIIYNIDFTKPTKFYVVAVSSNIESIPSNIVTILAVPVI